MIDQLTGILLRKDPGRCVVDVGGVGYGLAVSLSTYGELPETGERVSLSVHTYVREDLLTLYGFSSDQERSLFLRLISISGVGPKTAMAILSGLPCGELVEAITGGDCARLSTIPGVGRKTAERMVVELRDAIAREARLSKVASSAGTSDVKEDALSALLNLGYKRPAAEDALRRIGGQGQLTVEETIRAALRELCRT